MADEQNTGTKKALAVPYADMKNPFVVGMKGAHAEYILQDPEQMPNLALGAIVLIQDQRQGNIIWFAGKVTGLKSVSPFTPHRENLLYMEDEADDPTKILSEIKGPHTHQPMLIEVEITHEIQKNNEVKEFYPVAVQRPPSSSSRLFFPDIFTSTLDAPTLKDILDIKSQGIPFGNVGFGNAPYQIDNKFLTYRWDIDTLDNKHMFIVGESGSGKTVLLKNLALEIRRHKKDFRIIMTDVQGDISQLIVPDLCDKQPRKGWQTQMSLPSMKENLEHLGPFQLIIPYVPENDKNVNLIALKKLASNRGIKVSEIGLRLQDLDQISDVEYLFRVVSDQVASLLDDEAQNIRTDRNEVTIASLRERVNKLLQSQSPQGATGQVINSQGTPYYRTTCYAAVRALRNLENYFDNHQTSMESAGNPLDCFDFEGTSIIFLEHLNTEERLMWEMQLVKWLYDNKRRSWSAFVFIDEAHQVIPANAISGSSKGTFDRLRGNFEKLAREGRKFGINLVLSTQSPKDLHEIVPEQCPTRFVMKINPRNAQHAFVDKDLGMIANRFGHGQFWLQSPFNGTPEWVRVHSWVPDLPHQPMTSFWDKIIDAARREK